jgi:hypothetical protein
MNKTAFLAAALICSGAWAADKDKAPKKGEKQAAQVRCSGVNECKGKGECGGATTSCAGTNECKGKGWVLASEKDCKARGGKVEE